MFPPETLLDEVRSYVRELITWNAPGSRAATKHQLYTDLHRSVGEAVADPEARLEAMMRAPDFAEGVAALTGKRAPRWGGGAS